MINSVTTPSTTFTSESTPKHSPWITVWLYRLLMLGLGSSMAILLGIVLANIYPNSDPQKPLLLKLVTQLKTQVLTQLNPASNTTSTEKKSTDVTKAEAIVSLNTALIPKIQPQVQQLQSQIKALSERMTAVENQLGIIQRNESLENRLQLITAKLQESQLPSQVNNNLATGSTAKKYLNKTFKVTLPNDILFSDNYNILLPEAKTILDTVIADIANYPQATIRIAAYTDNLGQSDEHRELSLRRAQVIQQYLSQVLGDKYRWVVIGYGGSRPLVANDTIINQQRNRRIEISIDSRVD